MNEFEKRGIEKFFKSKLKNIDSQSDDWSTPPDFVFTNAIDSIEQTKKSKRKRLLIAFLLFTSLAILSTIIITQNRQINDVQESLKEMEDKLIANRIHKNSQNQAASELNVNSNPVNTIESTDEDKTKQGQSSSFSASSSTSSTPSTQAVGTNELVNKDSNKNTGNRATNSEKENLINVFTKHKTTAHQHSQKDNSLNSSGSSDHNSSFTLGNSIIIDSNANAQQPLNEMSSTSQIDGINTSNQLLLSFPELYQLELQSLNIISEKTSKHPVLAAFTPQSTSTKGFALTLNSGINLASFYMKNVTDPAYQNLVDYDKSCAGYFVETGLHYQFNDRWSAGLTLQYNKINNNSQYTQSSPVDQNNMSIVNNQREYAMPMEIITPLGSHMMNSKILFDENELVSNLISTSSDISQHLISYGLGVSAQYSFIRTQKINSYFGVNLSHHFIQDLNSGFQTKVEMDGRLKKQFDTNPKNMIKAYKDYNTLSAQLGIDYSINQRFNLVINSSIGRSLNSLTLTQTDTDPKTYLQYITTGVGVRYNLTSKN